MQAQVDEKRGDSNQQAERKFALPRRIEGIRLAEVRIARGPERDYNQKRQRPKRSEFLMSSKFQVSGSEFRVDRKLERGLSYGEPASEFQVGRQKLQSV